MQHQPQLELAVLQGAAWIACQSAVPWQRPRVHRQLDCTKTRTPRTTHSIMPRFPKSCQKPAASGSDLKKIALQPSPCASVPLPRRSKNALGWVFLGSALGITPRSTAHREVPLGRQTHANSPAHGWAYDGLHPPNAELRACRPRCVHWCRPGQDSRPGHQGCPEH